jgi:hypothetical protein
MRNTHFVFPASTRLLIKTLGPILVVALVLMILKPEAHAVRRVHYFTRKFRAAPASVPPFLFFRTLISPSKPHCYALTV